MGFKWKTSQSHRIVLIERPDIVNWRYKYLRAIKGFKEKGREIVYLDETWMDNNLTFKKCWHSSDIHGILTNTSSSNRLIVVHAGGKSGFIENALLIFKAGKTKGDYHGQMNSDNFEKWVTEKLLPNLPQRSVVVFDNAPYHCIQENKPPTKYSTKQEMTSWLQKNNIAVSEHMRKTDLMDLINKYKPPEKVFRVDQLLKHHGHDVLRLPPYMCDLSPIELAWAKAKRLLREQNVTADISLKGLEDATRLAISLISKEDWGGYCRHVDQLEEHYWEKDGIMEEAIEPFIINLQDDPGTSDSDLSDTSDLAHPLTDEEDNSSN